MRANYWMPARLDSAFATARHGSLNANNWVVARVGVCEHGVVASGITAEERETMLSRTPAGRLRRFGTAEQAKAMADRLNAEEDSRSANRQENENRRNTEDRWPKGLRIRVIDGMFHVGESGVITHNRVTEHDSGAFVRLDNGKGTALLHWSNLAPITDVED